MRPKTELFTVNGQPLLAPDAEVAVSYSDIDASDAGRDQDGVLHRNVVRYKVAAWSFQYSHLTEAEKRYMEGLFPAEATFVFGHPDRIDAETTAYTTCYRAKYGISWRDSRGHWSGYNFQIVEV